MNQRVRQNREEHIKRKNSGVKTKVTCYYMDKYLENIDEIPVLREARALHHLWSKGEIQLCSDEIIVGRLLCREPVKFHYGSGTEISRELAREWIRQEGLNGQAEEEFWKKLDRIDAKRYKPFCREIFTPEERASIEASAATSTFFGGHMVMDYDRILARGLGGIARDIENYSQSSPHKRDFYEAMSITLDGIRQLIRRHAEKALGMSRELYGETARRMKDLSDDLLYITDMPPVSFRQALQLVWFIHLVSDCDSFGRFDRYLYPFFKRDLESGRITMEEALELLEGFWIKIDEACQIQNMTIGGVDLNGRPSYNELTLLCLIATREVGFTGPNLCLRVNEEMPDEIWEEALKTIGTGQGLPALYNERRYIDFLVNMGIPPEDARNFCLAGCSQVMIPGKSNFVNDIGLLNVAKCLEITYMNGRDPVTGKELGLRTGDPSGFGSFDDFLQAFKKQMEYFCRLEADINNRDVEYRREREGYAVRTLLISDCLERGLGVYHGGAVYNAVQLECIGITNTADSLMAIKKAVFEDRFLSFGELVQALNANFQGYEELRQYLLKAPKFGNDCEEVDELRSEIAAFVFDEMRKQKGIAGGFYIPGEVIFVTHNSQGQATGATPDGRLAGEVLADSAGASQGMDVNGPTALLNSMLRMKDKGPVTTIVLNMKFTKDLWNSEGASSKIKTMFKSFFEGGGMQLQINVCDAETLQDAFEHPEKYRSLIVRVGGYSDYFVNLPRALQKEIIKRTAH